MSSFFPPPQEGKKYGAPPSHYVPGFGRGAIPFMTRSDIGPARVTPDPPAFGMPPSGYVAGFGRGAQAFSKEEAASGEGEREMEDYSDAKYDEWSGYGGSLFAMGDYDEEDKEADEIYASIDKHMDMRRKSRREKKIKEELEKMRAERPSIGQQFSGLKRDLAKMRVEDWLSIPEIGDYTVKKVKREKYIPVPDKLILQASQDTEKVTSVATNLKEGTVSTSLNDVGEARGTVLSLKLDKISDSVSGQTNVDAKGYLTDLNSLPIHDSADIGDYKKARLLLKSVITTNPKNAAGWIAAARVEELDGKLITARTILAQGIQNCPENEDLWLEAVRLESPEKSKALLGKAVSTLPKSVKLWLTAASQESEKSMKSKILRRSLENIPNSIRLWRELIELEGELEAKTLLHKAVECVPHCLEMWLALAKLETYENAKIVLNKARQNLPTEHSIWVNAAKVEESQGRDRSIIEKVIHRGLEILQKNGVRIKREEWLNDAILAEKSGNPLTCDAIIIETLGFGIENDDKERIWLEDADQCEAKENYITARAIYNLACNTFPTNKSIWLKAIQFENNVSVKTGSQNAIYLDSLLEKAIKACPLEELFWLMTAKRYWQLGKIELSRKVLNEADITIPGSEEIHLARAKLEKEVGEIGYAREWLEKAREKCVSVEIWIRSIKLEKEEKNYELVYKLCEDGCKKFPLSEKIWIVSAEFLYQRNKIDEARSTYERAIELIKTSCKLWISYINFEINLSNFPRARSILENSKVKIKKSVELWQVCINLELKANNNEGALYFIAKALQEIPDSGQLWALAIELEPKSTTKAKIVGALKHCDNDPLVLLAVGKLFWRERKLEKAKRWIEKAVALRPKLGDAWGYHIAIVEESEKCKRDDLRKKCIEHEPKEGRLWKIMKRKDGFKRKPIQILEMVLEEIIKEKTNDV